MTTNAEPVEDKQQPEEVTNQVENENIIPTNIEPTENKEQSVEVTKPVEDKNIEKESVAKRVETEKIKQEKEESKTQPNAKDEDIQKDSPAAHAGWDPELKKNIKLTPKGWMLIS